jgi:hypothetical protein
MNAEKLKLLAKDLTQSYPRSPRETLGGYVIAARTLDKCRASLNGTLGEYKFGCMLDSQFFTFAEIDENQFRDFVATGAKDEEVAEWIQRQARMRPRAEIIQWNNRMREMRVGELPADRQEFLEDYIAKFVPNGRVVYRWFDVYDLEEGRL